MIKKSLSVLLCIIMIFSCFSVAVPEVYAASGAKALFSVKGEPVAGNKIVYTISITKDRKNIGGMVLNVAFDSNVLKPTSKCAPIEKTTTAEGTVYNLQGTYVYDVSENNPGLLKWSLRLLTLKDLLQTLLFTVKNIFLQARSVKIFMQLTSLSLLQNIKTFQPLQCLLLKALNHTLTDSAFHGIPLKVLLVTK